MLSHLISLSKSSVVPTAGEKTDNVRGLFDLYLCCPYYFPLLVVKGLTYSQILYWSDKGLFDYVMFTNIKWSETSNDRLTRIGSHLQSNYYWMY